MALSAKAKNGSLIVLDNLDVADGKTKVLAGQLEKLGLNKALFIDGDAVNVSFAKASSNLNGVNVMPAMGANVYDILKYYSLVMRSKERGVGKECGGTCRSRWSPC